MSETVTFTEGETSVTLSIDGGTIIVSEAAIPGVGAGGDSGLTEAEAQALIVASVAALVDTAPATLDTLNELAAALGDDPNFATTVTTLIGTKQPLDSDLTAIAALSTTAYGRALLALADAAALRAAARVRAVVADDALSPVTVSGTPVSAFGSTFTIPALAAGDVVDIAIGLELLNNSGAQRNWTYLLKLGGSTIATVMTAALPTNASPRHGVIMCRGSVISTSDQAWVTTHAVGAVGTGMSALGTSVDCVDSAIDVSGSAALDLTVESNNGTATQSLTVRSVSVRLTGS